MKEYSPDVSGVEMNASSNMSGASAKDSPDVSEGIEDASDVSEGSESCSIAVMVLEVEFVSFALLGVSIVP